MSVSDEGQLATGTGRTEVCERVRRIALAMAVTQVDELRPDTTLVDDLGYDSLRLLELAIALETEFGLSGISTDEAVSITTVGGIEQLIVRVLEERG
jgi:acyl carrier protein